MKLAVITAGRYQHRRQDISTFHASPPVGEWFARWNLIGILVVHWGVLNERN
ncbi:hypothetical protein [Methylophaga sp. UBA1490]|uniref:hypothetical protein n=1 Tax=Methylophaga sp. UBA1490 TaxID=1946868 RepID=UPI0025D1E296|nr:hypothetical protein [Methylophaga sp. UBA1490]